MKQTHPTAAPILPLPTAELMTELQSYGVRLADPDGAGAESRRGGAGPSDHKAMTLDGMTIMVPVHTAPAARSPYEVERTATGATRILRDGLPLAEVSFPRRPRFYDLTTAEGVPYWKLATLHGRDVLATTVLQECVRYQSRAKTCQFCAIGQSLAAGRTVPRKTPEQLAEVAKAAVELDRVTHMVMTTGTPPGKDRGCAVLMESTAAVKAAVDLAIQVQCEPPDDDIWFARMHDAGADSLGMHLEAVTPEVRARIMPGKAQVPISRYMSAFAAAVPVFGKGQVSTYILAGLGDTREAILAMCEQLLKRGVYPFVVPFVPISGTPLEHHPAPQPAFMKSVLQPLAEMVRTAGLRATDIKAGCGKCGACSALSTYEKGIA